MADSTHIILGIHVRNRVKDAGKIQDLFTEFGCHIKTRIGLHQVDNNVCSPGGVILLEMHGDEARCFELRDKLGGIDGVEVQEMVFRH